MDLLLAQKNSSTTDVPLKWLAVVCSELSRRGGTKRQQLYATLTDSKRLALTANYCQVCEQRVKMERVW